MGLYANYPIALAPGMGLNAYFAFTVVPELGGNWQLALGCVFISGVLFFALSLSPLRAWLIDALPMNLKLGISAGIGLFLALSRARQKCSTAKGACRAFAKRFSPTRGRPCSVRLSARGPQRPISRARLAWRREAAPASLRSSLPLFFCSVFFSRRSPRPCRFTPLLRRSSSSPA
jgi:hypothetical protein